MNSPSPTPSLRLTQSSNGFNLVAPVKLDKTNYLLWKSMILPLIRGHRLEEFINDTNPCPPVFIETTTGTTPKTKFEEWQATDQLLLG